MALDLLPAAVVAVQRHALVAAAVVGPVDLLHLDVDVVVHVVHHLDFDFDFGPSAGLLDSLLPFLNRQR